MQKKWKLAVFIGRFQPLHIGHLQVINHALTLAEQLLILCGSSNTPRTLKNPFTFTERKDMISDSLLPQTRHKVHFAAIDDYPYDEDYWIRHVRDTVSTVINDLDINENQVALIGHHKDESSYYLGCFPEWQSIAVENYQQISATPIRENYLRDAQTLNGCSFLTENICHSLELFALSAAYSYLHQLQLQSEVIAAQNKGSLFSKIFVNVHAVIEYRKRLLFLPEKYIEDEYLLALPGGQLDENEEIFSSVIKQLATQTNISLSDKMWAQSCKKTKIYAAPARDELARVIAHVFYFKLDADLPLSFVDNDKDLYWSEYADLKPAGFQNDYYHIIRDLLSSG